MRSHHHQEVTLVPDDKLDLLRFMMAYSSLTKMVYLFIRDQCCRLGLMAPDWFPQLSIRVVSLNYAGVSSILQ